MKEKIYSYQPFLGLMLTMVSAVITSMAPSKEGTNNQTRVDQPAGVSFISSGGVESTVKQGDGVRSWTATGDPGDNFDGFSATSVVNDDNRTITFNAGCATGNVTTAAEDEPNCNF